MKPYFLNYYNSQVGEIQSIKTQSPVVQCWLSSPSFPGPLSTLPKCAQRPTLRAPCSPAPSQGNQGAAAAGFGRTHLFFRHPPCDSLRVGYIPQPEANFLSEDPSPHTQLFLFWLLVTISCPLSSPGVPRYPLLISLHSAHTFICRVLMKSSQFKGTIYLLPKMTKMPPKFKFFFISDHLDHLSMPHILFAHIIKI